jgi:hypothetical protein
MKKLTSILIAIVMLFSCEKKDNTCNCDDPLEDLPWMKEWKESFTNCRCRMAIFQSTYKKQTVFWDTMNDPLCDGWSVVVLRDCNGNNIKTYPSKLDEVFRAEVSYGIEIYYCKTK